MFFLFFKHRVLIKWPILYNSFKIRSFTFFQNAIFIRVSFISCPYRVKVLIEYLSNRTSACNRETIKEIFNQDKVTISTGLNKLFSSIVLGAALTGQYETNEKFEIDQFEKCNEHIDMLTLSTDVANLVFIYPDKDNKPPDDFKNTVLIGYKNSDLLYV